MLENEFDEEIKPQKKIPYSWFINPPSGMDPEMVREYNLKVGWFIPTTEAEIASLIPPDYLSKVEVKLGNEKNQKAGYLGMQMRIVVLHRSPIFAQFKDSGGKWVYAGIAYTRKGITTVGTKAKESKDYRLRNQYLVMPIGLNKELLSKVPIKITLSKGCGAALNNEIIELRREIEEEYFKSLGKTQQALSDQAHARIIFDVVLGIHKGSGSNTSAFVVPQVRSRPTLNNDQVGERNIVTRREREVTLINENLENLIIPKSTETGKAILEQYQAYKNFFDFPLSGESEETGETKSIPEEEDYNF